MTRLQVGSTEPPSPISLRQIVSPIGSGGRDAMKRYLRASSDARWFEPVLIAGCVLIFAVLTFALPSWVPLLEPDSTSYIEFWISRTALYPVFVRTLQGAGLSFVQITHLQVAIFCAALAFLLRSMRRAGVPPVLLVAFTIVLGANSYFTSFHRAILTESLVSSTTVIAVACLVEVLRTGSIRSFAVFSFCCGVIVGLRPAGLGILPMIVVTAWTMWIRYRTRVLQLALAAAVSLTAGVALERVPYHIQHGARFESMLPHVMSGKGAMLVRRNTEFSGPHAKELNEIGREFYKRYEPAREFLAGAPLLALPNLTTNYELIAQFQLLREEWARAAKSAGAPETELRDEFGKQAILANIPGYLRLALIHYVGQWSITALTFPPTARALNEYVSRHPDVPMRSEFAAETFRPPAKPTSWVIYPAFITTGLVTLILSVMFLLYLIGRPPAVFRNWWVFAAAFFSAMCHGQMIFVSFANLSSARYLMAVYPQICLIGVFLVMAAIEYFEQREPPAARTGIIHDGMTGNRT
jgi:hypothetical protein